MSAANRGAERIDKDFYSTAIKTIETFLNVYSIAHYKNIIEPSSGENALIEPIKVHNPTANIYTNDIRHNTPADYHFDFTKNHGKLISDIGFKPDLIITNPPFSLTMEFIAAGMESLTMNGDLIILQRVNFLGSNCRFRFWSVDSCLREVYVLHERPKFINGKTDATEYAWFIFDKFKHNYAKLFVI